MSPESINPYQSPGAATAAEVLEHRPRTGFVRHVRRVSTLMMVLGWLEVILGAFYGLTASLMLLGLWLNSAHFNDPYDANGRHVTWGAYGVSGILSCVNVVICTGIAGPLHLIAARYNAKFRSRTFGVLALAAGVILNFVIWAPFLAPLAVSLCIYGLLVYFRADVAQAFKMGEAGDHFNDILAQIESPLVIPQFADSATVVQRPALGEQRW